MVNGEVAARKWERAPYQQAMHVHPLPVRDRHGSERDRGMAHGTIILSATALGAAVPLLFLASTSAGQVIFLALLGALCALLGLAVVEGWRKAHLRKP